jgi:hypothetical protein
LLSPRTALLAVAAGAALSLAAAVPASAAPTSPGCLAAQNSLNAAQIQLQTAQNQLASDETTGASVTTLNADRFAVSQAQATVSQAQATVRIQCGTTTPGPVGNPYPYPRPNPGPVGLPRYNCDQLAARGLHDIPVGNAYYTRANDVDNDGYACDTVTTPTYRIINGQKCHLVNGAWVPVDPPVSTPNCCTSTVSAPPPVIYTPPVSAPGPVVQGAPVYIPGPVVSVPNTSLGVNNGDGSADITITIDLGNILSTVPVPTLPKV